MQEIWFWQNIVSPHMAGLALALVQRGCAVVYAAEEVMSSDRAHQGWAPLDLPGVRVEFVRSLADVRTLVALAHPDSVHVCQGIRGNGLISAAQSSLSKRRLRQWVVMETVNDGGWLGLLKRAEYWRLFYMRRACLQGVLAIGHRTTAWVAARGMQAGHVFTFAYFLPRPSQPAAAAQPVARVFRFVFAGRLIPLKRVDWLIDSLATLVKHKFALMIVGAGPSEPVLRGQAVQKLGSRVHWLGQLPLLSVPTALAQADCLVLPSVNDGWGAVISEALMAGTPVICSDACGAAGVVQASGLGGVFPVNDSAELTHLLTDQLVRGPVNDETRRKVSAWAACLGTEAGADYLLDILAYRATGKGARPVAPWLRERSACAA